jgi:nickel transport protein
LHFFSKKGATGDVAALVLCAVFWNAKGISMNSKIWMTALLLLALSGIGGTADAHKVSIFAWVEGDTVYTQSKFSGGKKVRKGTVEVYDDGGGRLLTGATDHNGEFSFKLPKSSPLKIVLIAGTGHKNEWTVPLEEIVEAGAPAASTTPAVIAESDQPSVNEEKRPRVADPPPLSPAQLKSIETAVEKALERKLRPMTRMLAEARDPGPGLTEILGGIGYIIGLVGLGAYIHSRKKSS